MKFAACDSPAKEDPDGASETPQPRTKTNKTPMFTPFFPTGCHNQYSTLVMNLRMLEMSC